MDIGLIHFVAFDTEVYHYYRDDVSFAAIWLCSVMNRKQRKTQLFF